MVDFQTCQLFSAAATTTACLASYVNWKLHVHQRCRIKPFFAFWHLTLTCQMSIYEQSRSWKWSNFIKNFFGQELNSSNNNHLTPNFTVRRVNFQSTSQVSTVSWCWNEIFSKFDFLNMSFVIPTLFTTMPSTPQNFICHNLRKNSIKFIMDQLKRKRNLWLKFKLINFNHDSKQTREASGLKFYLSCD